jgi:uncharacterized repeat protein (TIGR01451 family)
VPTLALTPSSPARDTGVSGGEVPPTDARGVARVAAPDRGSFEFGPPLPAADLFVTKSDGMATAVPGQVLTYTISVGNAGSNDVNGAMVSDTLPSGLSGASWTCSAAGGASCGSSSGAGSISQTVNLPVSSTVTYTLTATVAPSAATVRNTASVAVPAGFSDPNLANHDATDDDLLLCNPYAVVVPDGRITVGTLGVGATTWYLASLRIGSSYSAEFTNRAGAAGAPTLTVFRGDDGCLGTTSAIVRDTTAIDPTSGASARASFTASGTDPRYRFRVVNGTGASLSYTMSIAETVLFSPAWSTNGSYDTYYSLQNTTGGLISGTLTLHDVSGAVVGTAAITITPGQAIATNTAALGVVRNRTGTAQLIHDGPPGAVIAEAAIANFTLATAYVQPVRFLPARQ